MRAEDRPDDAGNRFAILRDSTSGPTAENGLGCRCSLLRAPPSKDRRRRNMEHWVIGIRALCIIVRLIVGAFRGGIKREEQHPSVGGGSIAMRPVRNERIEQDNIAGCGFDWRPLQSFGDLRANFSVSRPSRLVREDWSIFHIHWWIMLELKIVRCHFQASIEFSG